MDKTIVHVGEELLQELKGRLSSYQWLMNFSQNSMMKSWQPLTYMRVCKPHLEGGLKLV